MANHHIELAVRAEARVGEGPFWMPGRNALGWVDILGRSLHVSDLDDGTTSTTIVPPILGAALPRASGGHLLATELGFGLLDEHGGYAEWLSFLPPGERMNDAKVDPAGRVWAGSCELAFEPGRGALHRLGADGTHDAVVTGLTLPNGLGWSPDGRWLYLLDTMQHVLLRFPFDLATGEVGEHEVLTSFEGDGMPDGLCVDDGGTIWVAMWGGGRVLAVAPDGTIALEIPMPVAQPSSCAFGGEHGDVLFVTSAREGLELPPGSLDGSVFAVHGTGGRAEPAHAFAG